MHREESSASIPNSNRRITRLLRGSQTNFHRWSRESLSLEETEDVLLSLHFVSSLSTNYQLL
jgi:hypothetical protein